MLFHVCHQLACPNGHKVALIAFVWLFSTVRFQMRPQIAYLKRCCLEKMYSHIGCICLTILHYAFSNVSSNCLPEWMQSRIDCICFPFLHCAFSNDSSNRLPEWMQSRNDCIFVWLFSTGRFQMSRFGQ